MRLLLSACLISLNYGRRLLPFRSSEGDWSSQPCCKDFKTLETRLCQEKQQQQFPHPSPSSLRNRKDLLTTFLLSMNPAISLRTFRARCPFEYRTLTNRIGQNRGTLQSQMQSRHKISMVSFGNDNGEDITPGRLGGRISPRQVSSIDLGQLKRNEPFKPAQGDADTEYDEALRDAQRATARLKAAAERRLATDKLNRPRGARTTVSRTDAGTLIVNVPASGLGANSLMGGAFSVAWFSAVLPATFASGGAAALFMLPFWLAGGVVAKESVFDPAKTTTLSIGEFAWDIKQSIANRLTVSSAGGPTEELEQAATEVAAYINGVPSYVLRLYAGNNVYTIGNGLPLKELEWLSDEINKHLQRLELVDSGS